jgi:hypothetical protein
LLQVVLQQPLIIWSLPAAAAGVTDMVAVVVLEDIDLLHQYQYLQVQHILLLLGAEEPQVITNQDQLPLEAVAPIVH